VGRPVAGQGCICLKCWRALALRWIFAWTKDAIAAAMQNARADLITTLRRVLLPYGHACGAEAAVLQWAIERGEPMNNFLMMTATIAFAMSFTAAHSADNKQ
jgi:hypothetical protein